MAAKIWYKHIKPGDVVEVTLAKTHIWYEFVGDNKIQVTVEEAYSDMTFLGKFYFPGNGVEYSICLGYKGSNWGDGHLANIIRKVKQIPATEKYEDNEYILGY